jgi:hypothetical protein
MDIPDAADDFQENTEQQQPPAAEKIDAQALARTITAELMSEVKREQAMTPQQRERKTEKVIASMIEKGASEDGIKAVLDILRAYDEDRDQDRAESAQYMAYQQYQDALWAQAEEALEAFKSQVPGFGKAKAGLIKDISDRFRDDPDLKDGLARLKERKFPTAAQWKKAADKVIDEYMDEIGAVRKRGPVELKSSKPKPSSNDVFDSDSLDATERKLYLAYKNATGDEKLARKAVENQRRVTRGG